MQNARSDENDAVCETNESGKNLQLNHRESSVC